MVGPSRVQPPLQLYADLLSSSWPWGPLLLGLSFMILLLIIFCTRNAGEAFRSGNSQAFRGLPPGLDSDGLLDLRDRLETRGNALGALRRALRVGLVRGRGGLLISKSAVLAAWEAERATFRMWPRVMLAMGLTSLALAVLAAANQLPVVIRIWEAFSEIGQPPRGEAFWDPLRRAHALLTWGLTNAFISLLLYFVFDRITTMFLDRTTKALIRYLGAPAAEEGFGAPSIDPARRVPAHADEEA
ncbi:MAG: hypothetical protein AMXMBFR7_15040 [Planctomycetota bacterium]